MSKSATQDAPVSSVPPQVPEQEHAPDVAYFDGYKAVKEANPDSIVLYQVSNSYEMYGEDAKTAAALLGLNLTTRPGIAGTVDMCSFPVRNLDEQLLGKLRAAHAVTITLYDVDREKHLAYTLQAINAPAKQSSEVPAPQPEQPVEDSSAPDTVPYNFELEYRQLSRLKSDCEYFLGAGHRAQKHLSEGGIEAQIAKMRELYDKVPEKPEWLTAEDIDRYEAQMQAGAVAITVPNYQATVTAEEAPLLARLMADKGIETAKSVPDSGDVTFSFTADDRDAVEQLIAKLRAERSNAIKASQNVPQPKRAGRTRPELNYRAFAKLFPEIASGEYRYLKLESGPTMMPLHLEWIGKDEIAVSHTYFQNGDRMRDPEMTFRVDREKGTLEALTFQQDGFPQRYQEMYPEPGKWRPKLRSSLNSFAAQWMKNVSSQRYLKKQAVAVRDGEDVNVFFDPEGAPLTADDILMRETDSITAKLLNDERYANARRNSDEQNSRDECSAAINRIVVDMAATNTQFYNAYYGSPLAAQRFRDHLFQTTYQGAAAEQAAPSASVSPVAIYREALATLLNAVRGSSFYHYSEQLHLS